MNNYCRPPKREDDDSNDDDKEKEDVIIISPTEAPAPAASLSSRPRKKVRTEDPPPSEDCSKSTMAEHSSSPSPFQNVDHPDPLPKIQAHDVPENNQVKEEATQVLLDKARQSPWYRMFLAPDLPNAALRHFKKRFGHYEDFLSLKEEIMQLPEFAQWRPGNTDHTGLVLDLLILGSLRRIRGMLDFDDMFMLSTIDEEIHRQFFLQFEEYRLAHKHRAPWARIRPNRQYHRIDEIENEDWTHLLL